ncbi:GFA family protein [Salinicola sp. V024]|uniref:GFA family protein n=1 Tax=Salinicola sp. V024 TaxID=3459609 RepID=UPI0040449CA1
MKSSASRQASCACGQLTLEVSGEPIRISVCHCQACQRRSGAPFAAQARYPRARVRLDREYKTFVRVADSGNEVTAHFCPHCGSTLCYWLAVDPDVLAVAIGAFGDSSFPPPNFSMHDDQRYGWIGLPASIEYHP